jgi:hypothetical protein
VLRALHAKHAEDLVSIEWPLPDGRNVRLLEDSHLRDAYGKTIGRIAHSHHWDVERLETLRQHTGPASDFPNDWTLDEIKVACMLRCADAAHIDDRRAPSLLYALRRPQGIADTHWRFQNKLNKPTRDPTSNHLIYTAGPDDR